MFKNHKRFQKDNCCRHSTDILQTIYRHSTDIRQKFDRHSTEILPTFYRHSTDILPTLLISQIFKGTVVNHQSANGWSLKITPTVPLIDFLLLLRRTILVTADYRIVMWEDKNCTFLTNCSLLTWIFMIP